MKKVLKLTLAVVLMLSASSLYAQKFGRVDFQEVVGAMPEVKEMNTTLDAQAKDWREQLETIQVEFNQKLADYQKNGTTLSDAARQLKEKELQELSNRAEEFQQLAQQDLQRKQQELLNPIIEKAREAINKVLKAGGFTAIFDTSSGAIVSFDEANLIDVTPQVRKELGITDAPAA